MAEKPGQPPSLRKRRGLAVAALAAGGSIAASARAAGVSARTVNRWLTDRSFAAEVEKERREALTAATSRLGAAATLAAATLVNLLGEHETAMIRLGAAKAILDGVLRMRNELELERRIEAIEAAFAGGQR